MEKTEIKYYAVIDTNVLVAAMLSSKVDSATVLVINKIISDEVVVLYSQEIIKEYNDVLFRHKLKIDPQLAGRLIEKIIDSGKVIDPHKTNEILPDMKDLPFYEVVMEKKDDGAYLVTGNMKHFPSKPFIVTPREFLDIIDK